MKLLKKIIIIKTIFDIIFSIIILVGIVFVLSELNVINLDAMGNTNNINDSTYENISMSNFVQYYQNDYSDIEWGGGTVATSGCGPTSFAMVLTNLANKKITPQTTATWCKPKDYYVEGAGMSWDYFQAATNYFNNKLGLSINFTSTTSIEEVVKGLKSGNIVISSQKKGIFTQHGHFIVLASIDNNGKIKVADPNKNNATVKTHGKDTGYNNTVFTQDEINESAKNYWIFKNN